MRKNRFRIILFGLIIFGLVIKVKIQLAKGDPNVIFVDDDNITGPWYGTSEYPYKNITNALIHSSSGDIIQVYDGIYYEKLIIDKPISLKGQRKQSTIINGDNAGTVVEIRANNVILTNFTIRHAGFWETTWCGICLEEASNCTISNILVTTSHKGIWVVNSSGNLFESNIITQNLEGIYFNDSNDNYIRNNRISSNQVGILLYNSSSNNIFHNNLVNNSQSISNSMSSMNQWDNGLEGNYLNDYNGSDLDQDGIGDTPLIIDSSNQDNYPLMGPFSRYETVFQNIIYSIHIICNITIVSLKFNETTNSIDIIINGTRKPTFFRVRIPHLLINRPHTILIDDNEIIATHLTQSNTTHTFLYFILNSHSQLIKILPSTYFEILENLHKLIDDFKSLNESYTQLLTDFKARNILFGYLSELYFELLLNNTMLNQLYDYLNQSYTVLGQLYDYLNQSYTKLDQLYNEAFINYVPLKGEFERLQANFTRFRGNYTKLLDQTNLTKLNIQVLIVALIAIIGLAFSTTSLCIKYYSTSKNQKKLVQEYRWRIHHLNYEDVARMLFKADVERREDAIREFEKRHNVTLRLSNTLEDAIGSFQPPKKTQE